MDDDDQNETAKSNERGGRWANKPSEVCGFAMHERTRSDSKGENVKVGRINVNVRVVSFA